MSKGFIQIQRQAEELLDNDQDAYLLMSQIMFRTLRKNSKYNKYKLKVNQALIGDYKSIGMTEQRYRETKKRIEYQYKLVSFKGTNKGTIATLLNLEFCDINCEYDDEKAIGQQRTNNEPTTNQQRTNNEPTTNRTNRVQGTYVEKIEQYNEPTTNQQRTNNEPTTTKEEGNNTISKKTTTPLTPQGENVVVFYDCLKENTDLAEDEKEYLQKYPENRVILAFKFSKEEKPTKDLIHQLVWHCNQKNPPISSKRKFTDQQRMAIDFNAYLLAIGQELMAKENETLILDNHMLIPMNGRPITISLNNHALEVKKDFEQVKVEQRKIKYG